MSGYPGAHGIGVSAYMFAYGGWSYSQGAGEAWGVAYSHGSGLSPIGVPGCGAPMGFASSDGYGGLASPVQSFWVKG